MLFLKFILYNRSVRVLARRAESWVGMISFACSFTHVAAWYSLKFFTPKCCKLTSFTVPPRIVLLARVFCKSKVHRAILDNSIGVYNSSFRIHNYIYNSFMASFLMNLAVSWYSLRSVRHLVQVTCPLSAGVVLQFQHFPGAIMRL